MDTLGVEESIPDAEANHELHQIDLTQLQFISEQDGYRYYEDLVTKAQYSVDSVGYWYIFNTEHGSFEPFASSSNPSTEISATKKPKKKNKHHINCGIQFDDDDYPIFPKNDNGLPILPKDENGQPFFPMDDQRNPIFPWDHVKKKSIFPVDDTDEPIFPRNDQNKPMVPQDENGNNFLTCII